MRELHADLIEGLVRPVAEPVKNTTIEQCRRRRSTRSKADFGRVHSEGHMDIFSDSLSEPSIKLLVRVEHQPALWEPSLQAVMSAAYSSPSKRPGTSALARRVFIRSKKPESRTLDSSIMKQIFSPLQPNRRKTIHRSSSKSSPVHLLETLIWKMLSLLSHATKRERVVCTKVKK
jgi:hypothetical protein